MRAAIKLRHEPILSAGASKALASPVFRWAIAPSLIAWAGILILPRSGVALPLCVSAANGAMDGAAGHMGTGMAGLDPVTTTLAWALMLTAMMPPLLVPMISRLSARSFIDRRDRCIGLFVAGYACVWSVAAAIGTFLVLTLQSLAMAAGLTAFAGLIGAAAAAGWQMCDAKRRALNRCHGFTALRAFGREADTDALRFGAVHGGRCLRACGPTMALGMVGAHGPTMMVAMFAVLLGERIVPRPRQFAGALLLLTAGLAGLAV
jgi:predicted metal-binding membrane protein